MAQQPPVGQGHHIIEDSWSNSETSHLVGLLWKSDQPDADNSSWQHTTLTTGIDDPVGFEPTISASERPQTHASDRAGTGIGYTPIASLQFTPNSPTLYSPNKGIRQLQDIYDQNKTPKKVNKVKPFEWSSNIFSEGTKRPFGHQDVWIHYI
jgi:hypothetical protein